MMKRLIYFIFLTVFYSCSSKDKPPSHIIQSKEMKSIIWDVMRAQALALEIVRKDSLVNDTAETKALTQKVFDIHKISAADFDKSYQWYVKHPEALKQILDSLYNQKQRDNEVPAENKISPDSLHKRKSLFKINHEYYLPLDTAH